MSLTDILLCLTAGLAGAINSVAGGGTLLTFPALFRALGDVRDAGVLANGTSTLALWPGSLAATWGYRGELRRAGRWIGWLLPPSLLGGFAGALLVVNYPDAFQALGPFSG